MFFRRKRDAERLGDKVWMSSARKYDGLMAVAAAAGAQPWHVVFVAHFRKTYDALSARLEEARIPARRCQSSIDRLGARGMFRRPSAGAVALFMSTALPEPQEDSLQPSDGDGAGSPAPDAGVHIVVAERYPVPEPDLRIGRFADSLRVPVRLEFHSALDEPLFRIFGGDRLLVLLKKLGLKENECQEHKILSKAIQNAQNRLAGKLPLEGTADSMAEWLERNAPEAFREQ
jgi:hypothetical protein